MHILMDMYIQDGPKVGIQYIVNYGIPTFSPSYIYISASNFELRKRVQKSFYELNNIIK